MTVDDGAAVAALGAFGAWLGHVAVPFLRTLLTSAKRRSEPPHAPPQCSPTVEEKLDDLHGLLARRTHTGASHVLERLDELPRIRELLERMLERGRPPFGSNHSAE